MTPPINIDGTNENYSNVTIDGQSVKQITVDGQEVLSKPLVAHWTFDNADTSGSTCVDIFDGNDGTINGATTGVSGANQTYTTNEAYSFDGVDDTVDIPDFGNLGQAYSVACWFKHDGFSSGFKRIISFNDASGDYSIIWQELGSSNAFRLGHADNAGTQQSVKVSPNSGVYNHYVVTWDGATLEVYENGSSVGTTSVSSMDTNGNGNSNAFGARGDQQEHFAGDIDDPRIYDRALSSTEVSNLFNNGSI